MIAISNNINFGLSLAQSATQERIERAIERLSTGKRINKAKDDVSGLQISSRLEVEIAVNRESTENAKYIQNTLDTANEAASNTQSQLLKLRELAVRSANGTLSQKDIELINQEADQIIKSIDKTASSTSFAGVKLLDGTFTNKNFAVTNSQNGSISIAFDNLSHEALGLKNLDLSKHVSKQNIREQMARIH